MWTIAGKCRQPNHPTTDELDNKNVANMHNRVLFICQEKME